ncbi:MAG: DUF4013 domain-containing protein [Methanospirillum sp.]
MDIGTMLGDALDYTQEALVGKWMRWLILLIGTIIFPIILGYTLRVYRGEPRPPDPRDWVGVFVDGIKLFVVELIWAIPVIIVLLIFFGGAIALMTSGSNAATAAGIGTMLIGIPILIIVAIVVALFATMGAVRFARTDSFGEAFNFSAILAHIGRIGWGHYILALIVLMVIIGVISFVLGIIPIIGWIISIVIGPAISIYAARYMTQLYDSAPAPA